MSMEKYVKDILWESIPSISFKIKEHGNIPNYFECIHFSRNEKLDLDFILEAKIDVIQNYNEEHEQVPKGTIISCDNVLKANTANYELETNGIVINNTQYKLSEGEILATGDTRKIRIYRINNDDTKIGRIIYKFLNGVDKNILYYPDNLTINYKDELSFKYSTKDNEESVLNFSNKWIKNGLEINLGENKIFLTTIHEETTNIGLKGTVLISDIIFSEDEIYSISKYLSFIFGTIIVPFGWTKYDQFNKIIEETFFSAGHFGITDLKSLMRFPPINLSWREKFDIKSLFSNLLKAYLREESIFNLNDIISYINISRISYTEVMQLPLAAAFDLLKKQWFKQNPFKSVYISKDNFDTLTKDLIKALADVLPPPVINRIKTAFNMGENERTPKFINDLNLTIGAKEEESIAFRNKVVHGSINKDNTKELIENYYCFMTLLNRIILKILDYNGKYIDYSTLDYPEKHIKEAQ